MNTPPIDQQQKKSDLINKIKTAASSLSMQESFCKKDCMKVLHIIQTNLFDKLDNINTKSLTLSNNAKIKDILQYFKNNEDFKEYIEVREELDEWFYNDLIQIKNIFIIQEHRTANCNLDYDEQLIEITNQDIQFAFEKFTNRKDRNSLTDLIQAINKNTK